MGASSNMNQDNNIIDIDLSALRKKRIRINGDDNKIVEINTSDMNVMGRLQSAYDQLIGLVNEYNTVKLSEEDSDEENSADRRDEEIKDLIEKLTDIDLKMRNLVDFIFDANISEVCVDGGTMADPFNGQFRFEWIIEKFLALYDENFTKEFKKMSSNVQKHTGKYTRKK